MFLNSDAKVQRINDTCKYFAHIFVCKMQIFMFALVFPLLLSPIQELEPDAVPVAVGGALPTILTDGRTAGKQNCIDYD